MRKTLFVALCAVCTTLLFTSFLSAVYVLVCAGVLLSLFYGHVVVVSSMWSLFFLFHGTEGDAVLYVSALFCFVLVSVLREHLAFSR